MNKADRVQQKISIKGIDQLKLFGHQDSLLRKIDSHYKSKIVARGSEILLEGEAQEVEDLKKIFYELTLLASNDKVVSEKDLEAVIELVQNKQSTKAQAYDNLDSVILYTKDGAIKPKSVGQKAFLDSSVDNDIVFVIGPAGTGKTFLAVAIAVAALRDKLVSRIVLTRPAVEAGESLGFLPGDFREKVDPYLKPFYDALHQMIPPDKLKRYLETQIIEIVPLAYMRGRTLNNAFAILDEAQNTLFNQMKMFLTRLGMNSKAIITGDVTQIDLSNSKPSGLVQIQSIVYGIEGIDFVYLNGRDVARHRLVREIIKAYEDYESQNGNKKDS